MAPELFHGTKNVQSDLYAFGIVLYEWLSQIVYKQTLIMIGLYCIVKT
jgi:serine/threonine protein kinase